MTYSGQTGNSYNKRYSDNHEVKKPEIIAPKDVPEDYVEAAREVMYEIGTANKRDSSKLYFKITTSKLRNILSLVSDIYNVESRRQEQELLTDSVAKLQMLRVRVLYEVGRDKNNDVRQFVDKSNLIAYIKGIGTSREKMIRFSHYMEALVAYHRFYGGRET